MKADEPVTGRAGRARKRNEERDKREAERKAREAEDPFLKPPKGGWEEWW